MILRFAALPAAALALSGCVTVVDNSNAAPAPMACDAAAVQGHIGHDATSAMGEAILSQSGARTLRWGPPGAVWTMDMRPDRVNVRFDDKNKIIEITCG